jgi:hypothetical protein
VSRVWLFRLIFATTPTTYNLHTRENLLTKVKRTRVRSFILLYVYFFFPCILYMFSERIFFMLENENIILHFVK